MGYYRVLIHYNTATGKHATSGGLGDPMTLAHDPKKAAIKALQFARPQVKKAWILIQVVEEIIEPLTWPKKFREFGETHTFRPHHLEDVYV